MDDGSRRRAGDEAPARSRGHHAGQATDPIERLLAVVRALESRTPRALADTGSVAREPHVRTALRRTGSVALLAALVAITVFAFRSPATTGLLRSPYAVLATAAVEAVILLDLTFFHRRLTRRVRLTGHAAHRFFPHVVGGAVVAVIALLASSSTPEEGISRSLLTIGVLILVRGLNGAAHGQDLRQRFFRLTFARQSYRAVTGSLILVASWAFLVTTIKDTTGTSATPLAVSGPLIAAATATTGAVSRVMLRQRRHATQVVEAMDELDTALGRRPPEVEATRRAWLTLDRRLRTGVDTGVPLFATPTESEHMRAVLAACVHYVLRGSDWPPEAELDRESRRRVASWGSVTCQVTVRAYLRQSRPHFAALIDTAA